MNSELLDDAYATERRQFLVELCALPESGDVLQWQRRLADAIIRAERESDGPRRRIAKQHRHLLRVIGDALVHTLLPSHTIRTLSRAPGKPAHLSSQGENLDFVFESAQKFQAVGCIPIVADLTTLVGVGDLVVVVADGGISVLECKNRKPATGPLRGRLARQMERGAQVEEYLSSSYLDEGDIKRVAIEYSLPEPEYDVVQRLAESCMASSSGVAVHWFGEGDVMLACVEDADVDEVMSAIETLMAGDLDSADVAIAFIDELVQTASHRRPSPSSYPLSADLRWQFLERNLHLVRLVDTSGLASEGSVGETDFRLAPRHGQTGLEVVVEGFDRPEELVFTSAIVEMCLWSPISVVAMQTSLLNQALATLEQLGDVQSEDLQSMRAPGDLIAYATLYNEPQIESRPMLGEQ